MATGTIVNLKPADGCGFIKDEEGTQRFFHISDLRGYEFNLRGHEFTLLRHGDRVTFTQEQTVKGPRARDVHRIIEADAQ